MTTASTNITSLLNTLHTDKTAYDTLKTDVKTAVDTYLTVSGSTMTLNVSGFFTACGSNPKNILYNVGSKNVTNVTVSCVSSPSTAIQNKEYTVIFQAAADASLTITNGILLGPNSEITSGNYYMLLVIGGKYVTLVEQNS